MNLPTDGAAERPASRTFRRFQQINRSIEVTFAYAAGAFLALFTVVVAIDVVYRQILQAPMMWPSEWATMSFVWSVMLGACVSARRNTHFVVELLPLERGPVDTALKVIVGLLGISFGIVLLWFGWGMAVTGMRRFTPMMGYPMVYVFAAFPVAGAAIALFTFEQLLAALLHHHSTLDDHPQGGVA